LRRSEYGPAKGVPCVFGRNAFHRLSCTKRAALALIFFSWIAGVAIGMALLVHYSNTPGAAGAPPIHWPADSTVPRPTDEPTLLMFVHPHCPCSRSSIGELATLMRHCRDRVDAHVLFVRPAHMPEEWEKTDLWRSASAIPGVSVQSDAEGVEARHFGAATSGAVVLYDRAGELIFYGGITGARGHFGDNVGRQSVTALLTGERPPRRQTFVFGCALFDTHPQCRLAGGSEDQCCRP
jgi:hypothetical protein